MDYFTDQNLCLCGCGKKPRKGRKFAKRSCCFQHANQQKINNREPKPVALCLCGCGREVKPRNRFVSQGCARRYHAGLKAKASISMCPCGCNGTVKSGNKWANPGCHSRGKKRDPYLVATQAARMTDLWGDPTRRAAQSERTREKHKDPDFRDKYLASQRILHGDAGFQARRVAGLRVALKTPKVRAQRSATSKNMWQDPSKRENLVSSMKLAGEDPNLRAKRRELSLDLWRDPKFKAKMAEGRAGGGKPSGLHLAIKGEMVRVGIETTTHVLIGYHVVDEAGDARRLVVEVNGCYWHSCPVCGTKGPRSNRHDKAKRTYLRNHGWTLIEIWEHEWKSNPKSCIQRILALWESLKEDQRDESS